MDVNEMRASRDKAVVAFTKFAQCKDLYTTCVFCFFEGEDAKYYEPRIEKISKIPYDKIISFNCGGKKGVKKLYNKIAEKSVYSVVKKMFFIDRDYYPICIESEELFETPCYSIENYYTSNIVFEKVLKREFGMNVFDEDFKKCKEIYKRRYDEFHECVLELNAWLKCQRRKDIENGYRGIRIDWKIAKYFEQINLDGVILKQPMDKEFMEKLYPEAEKISEEELNIEVEKMKTIDQQKFFRGKFELELLINMIFDLREKNKKGGYLSEKYECVKIDPRVDTLTSLSRDADTPDQLIAFLSRYKGFFS